MAGARKTEVYTWRLSTATKAALEEAARDRERSVADLLDEIVAEYLTAPTARPTETEHQRRLHARAARFAGAFRGGAPNRSQTVRARVRARLVKRKRNVR